LIPTPRKRIVDTRITLQKATRRRAATIDYSRYFTTWAAAVHDREAFVVGRACIDAFHHIGHPHHEEVDGVWVAEVLTRWEAGVAEGVSELEEKWESTVEPLAAVEEVQGDFIALEEEFEEGVGEVAGDLRKVSVMQRGSSVRLLILISCKRGSLLQFHLLILPRL
jgi:hypothetical protein